MDGAHACMLRRARCQALADGGARPAPCQPSTAGHPARPHAHRDDDREGKLHGASCAHPVQHHHGQHGCDVGLQHGDEGDAQGGVQGGQALRPPRAAWQRVQVLSHPLKGDDVGVCRQPDVEHHCHDRGVRQGVGGGVEEDEVEPEEDDGEEEAEEAGGAVAQHQARPHDAQGDAGSHHRLVQVILALGAAHGDGGAHLHAQRQLLQALQDGACTQGGGGMVWEPEGHELAAGSEQGALCAGKRGAKEPRE